jgi:hypothetical protein
MAAPILSGLAALTVEEKARAKAAPAMNERSVFIFSPHWFRWRGHTTMGTDRLMNVAFRQMNTPAPTENQKGPSLKFKRDRSPYDRMKRGQHGAAETGLGKVRRDFEAASKEAAN